MIKGIHSFVAYEGDVEYVESSRSGLLVPLNPIIWAGTYENLIVDTGKHAYLDRLAGLGSVGAFTSLGVGTDSAAPAAANTRLNAPNTGSAYIQGCDATFPSRAGLVLTYRSTFGTAVANFTWAEAGIFNGTTNGASVMFNRVLVGPFTKTATVSIVYTATVAQS